MVSHQLVDTGVHTAKGSLDVPVGVVLRYLCLAARVCFRCLLRYTFRRAEVVLAYYTGVQPLL